MEARSTNTAYQKKVSVVVLAAGMSTRMGQENKLLLDVAGDPLILRTLKTLKAHDFAEIIVVTGHESEQLSQLISELDVKIIFNENYQEGQMTSVHTGMSALSETTDGVMVFLSDLALIDSEDLDVLRVAFDECDTGVLVPTYSGKRGNPIILEYKQRDGIVSGDRNLGCKRLIEKNPELVTPVEMKTDHVLMDMDTPEAYAEVKRRLNQTTNSRSGNGLLEEAV